MWLRGTRLLRRGPQLWDQPRRLIKLNRSALEADSPLINPPLSTSDQDAEYMDTLMREYPALASRGHQTLAMREKISNQTTAPWTETRSFSFFFRPVAVLGRHVHMKQRFPLHFTTNSKESVTVQYGSILVQTGARVELGVRAGISFVTGISQILPKIPPVLEIAQGWELSFFRIHVAQFQVFELPTQRFWMLSMNAGLGLGFQTLHGILYVADQDVPPVVSSSPSWLWNLQDLGACLFVGLGALLLWSTGKQLRSVATQRSMRIPVLPSALDPQLPRDLYEVGKV